MEDIANEFLDKLVGETVRKTGSKLKWPLRLEIFEAGKISKRVEFIKKGCVQLMLATENGDSPRDSATAAVLTDIHGLRLTMTLDGPK